MTHLCVNTASTRKTKTIHTHHIGMKYSTKCHTFKVSIFENSILLLISIIMFNFPTTTIKILHTMYLHSRYPSWVAKDHNLFHNVHMMDEKHLERLVGMKTRCFWSLCDLISGTGIMSRCPNLSLPSLLLLWRIKLRQGVANMVLSSCFLLNENTISSLFWLMSLNYYEISNQLPR